MPTFSESSDSLGGPHKQDHHNHIAQGNLQKSYEFRLRLHHPLFILRPLFVCNFCHQYLFLRNLESYACCRHYYLATSSEAEKSTHYPIPPSPPKISPLQKSVSYFSPDLNNVTILQVYLACHEDTVKQH
jgi:hypothetical protein